MAIINLKDKITLSGADIQAIICALPLVSYGITETPEQAFLNNSCCAAAKAKLLRREMGMTPNEYRVIFIAIATALDILSNKPIDYLTDFYLDPEWHSELTKNFFAYSRLYPQFDKVLDYLDK